MYSPGEINHEHPFASSRIAPENPAGDFAFAADRALSYRFDAANTLVISGFWRSGTTWLEEALREILFAKTIFEPLCPLADDSQAIYRHHGVAAKSVEFLRLFLPFCNAKNLESHPLHDLFRQSLLAQSSGSWIRRFRKDLQESFRPRLVIKFVRAQLCLRAAQNTFGMPVLHVYRDPRAVIASIKKTRWHWLFEHLSLREQLLDIPDGRAEYFSKWRDEIAEYDRQNTVARTAAYWMMIERFVQESYIDFQGRFFCVSYEKLVQERENIFSQILDVLQLRPWRDDFQVTRDDSTTTSDKQVGASMKKRIAGWRRTLSVAEVETIETIARRFGFEDRLSDGPIQI